MTLRLRSVRSRDGTQIGYDCLGAGPVLVLVPGETTDRVSNAEMAAALAKDFTVIDYDRRIWGESSDTLDDAVDREIEDIEAIIDAVGGSSALYGTRSGAALAFVAARALRGKVTRLVVGPPLFDPTADAPAERSGTGRRLAVTV